MNYYKQLKGAAKTFYNERLEFIDEIQEGLSMRQQQLLHRYEQSIGAQRRLTYTKAFFRSAAAIIFVSSIAGFIHDSMYDLRRPYDVTIDLISTSNNLDSRMYFAFDSILGRGRELNELDPLTYLSLGHLYSQVNQPEFAQTAYYLAHLKTPREVGANSDLQFDTVTKKGQ